MKRNISVFTLWLLGPTSSGKTTLANLLLERINTETNLGAIHFDGDEIRDMFGSDFGFTAENRLLVVQALVHLANKSQCSGLCTLISALTAYPQARSYVKDNCENLITVYVKCNISTCMERDPKGLYKKASNSEINTLIGYNAEYAPPQSPDIIVQTDKFKILECVEQLFIELKLRNYFE